VLQKPNLVLHGARIINGLNPKAIDDKTVIVEEGTIVAIGKKEELRIPHDAVTLDLTGKILVPGLIDSHLHLAQSGVDDFSKPFAERMYTKLKRNAYLTLKSGVTTIRNMPGGSSNVIGTFKRRVEQGVVVGPRILASGPALAPSYGYFSLKRFFPPNPLAMAILSRVFGANGLAIDVDTPEEARKAVNRLKKSGADFVKTVTPGAYIPFAQKDLGLKESLVKQGLNLRMIEASMKPDVLRAIVNKAHDLGLKVAAHTIAWPEDMAEAVKAGVDSIEHTPLGLIHNDTFAMMEKHTVYWVPTAYPFYHWTTLIDHPEEYEREEIKELIPEPFYSVGKRGLEKLREGIKSGADPMWSRFYAEMEPFKKEYFPENFRRAKEKGVKIVAGVDAGASGAGYVPHGQLINELELFVAHGMSEFEAIQTATTTASELLGLEGRLGSIEVGKAGDFVVLDADPLENISNLRKVSCVFKEGILLYRRQ